MIRFITIHLVSSSPFPRITIFVTIFIVVLNITWLGVENAARRHRSRGSYYERRCGSRKWRACQVYVSIVSKNHHLYVTIFIVVLNITWLGVENAARRSRNRGSYNERRCASRKWRACQVYVGIAPHMQYLLFPAALTSQTRDVENGVLMLTSTSVGSPFLGSLKRYLRASLSTVCVAQLAASSETYQTSEMTNEVISQALPGKINSYNWFVHSNVAIARAQSQLSHQEPLTLSALGLPALSSYAILSTSRPDPSLPTLVTTQVDGA